MEKNRIRPVKVGNGVRMSYAKQQEVLDLIACVLGSDKIAKGCHGWYPPWVFCGELLAVGL